MLQQAADAARQTQVLVARQIVHVRIGPRPSRNDSGFGDLNLGIGNLKPGIELFSQRERPIESQRCPTCLRSLGENGNG